MTLYYLRRECLGESLMDAGAPTVADVLATKERKIIAIKESALLREAAASLYRNHIGMVVVIGDDNGFRGVLSERDIIRAFAEKGAEAAPLKVSDIATHTVRACDPSRTLDSVLESMRNGHFRHMPVVEGGQIRGVISATDILAFLAR
jgi:CBS domain-containing protein